MTTAASTLTPEQYDEHYSGIGGSMAPAIMGVDPYRTRLDAYDQITDPSSRPDLSDKQPVQAGIYLEPGIRKFAAEALGKEIYQSHKTLYHREHPILRGHIDGFIRKEGNGQRAGVEIKNRGFFRGKEYGEEGSDQVLDSELIQCMFYLALTGWDRWYLAVLIGGQELKLFTIERDQQLIDSIVKTSLHFWNKHVQKRIPPPPTTLGDIKNLYPEDSGESVILSSQSQSAIQEIKQLKEQIKELKSQSDALELIIKTEAEDGAILTDVAGTTLATWKAQTANRVDTRSLKSEHPDICEAFTKQTTSRVLRLK